MNMTDGYKITVKIDLVIAGDKTTGNTNGMCFGSDPDTNGGYCLTWEGDNTLAAVIKREGFNAQYIPAASWLSTTWPGSTTGTILTPANSGLVMIPDTTERATCPLTSNCASSAASAALSNVYPVLIDGENEEG
jgi:hypothetical protein